MPSRPVAQHQQPSAPRAFDVFLSHCGGEDRLIKMVLSWVRRELQSLSSTDGSAPICAFRDEDDLKDTGPVRDALQAAICQSPIGACSLLLPLHLLPGC